MLPAIQHTATLTTASERPLESKKATLITSHRSDVILSTGPTRHFNSRAFWLTSRRDSRDVEYAASEPGNVAKRARKRVLNDGEGSEASTNDHNCEYEKGQLGDSERLRISGKTDGKKFAFGTASWETEIAGKCPILMYFSKRCERAVAQVSNGRRSIAIH